MSLKKEMSYQEWCKKYRPVINISTIMKETQSISDGQESRKAEEKDPFNLWTEVNVDGSMYIVNGPHFVNKTRSITTELPWEKGDNIVVIV